MKKKIVKLFSVAIVLIVLSNLFFSTVYAANWGYVLNPEETMDKGECLVSQNGKYKLCMQDDGNLVIYNAQWKSIWSSGTYKEGDRARFCINGNFLVEKVTAVPTVTYELVNGVRVRKVIYTYKTDVTFTTNTHGNYGAIMVMQDDGNLVIYNSQWKAVWSSGTWGQ